VAVFSAVGVLMAAWRFGVTLGFGALVAGALVAAVAESVSPKSLDNLTVPLAVWALYC